MNFTERFNQPPYEIIGPIEFFKIHILHLKGGSSTLAVVNFYGTFTPRANQQYNIYPLMFKYQIPFSGWMQ